MRNEFDWYKWVAKPVAIAVLIMIMAAIFMGGVRAEDKTCVTEVEKFDKVIELSLKAGYTLNVLDSFSSGPVRGFLVQPEEDPEKNVPMWFFFTVVNGCAEAGFPSWYPETEGNNLIKRLEGQGV